MEDLLTLDALMAFATLTVLEIVLGIDNIVFISILTGRLPVAQRPRARLLGLAAAMVMRIALLLSLAAIMRLTEPLFTIMGLTVSGRDLILLGGGAFLMAKATREVHNSLEGDEHDGAAATASVSFLGVLAQIAVIDVVFSLDSVITAVGLVDQIPIMVAAIVVAVLVMMAAAGAISRFIEAHPTVKMLALTFLLLIGATLIAEGLDFHVPKGYIYFAMAFSFGVEMLNIRAQRKRRAAVRLRKAQLGDLIR
ncbi:MAG: TerC family protein [Pseudomonadota bacterium]